MKKLVFFMLLFLTVATFGQSNASDTISAKIVGRWTLIKRTLPEVEKKTIFHYRDIYEFLNDSTYNLIAIDTMDGSKYVTKGKWQVVENGKKIKVYSNSSDGVLKRGDYYLPIIKLTETDFVTQDNWYKGIIGTEYYKK